jgi:hypothetical protein
MWRKIGVLERAIGKLDFLAAWCASNDLQKTMAYAKRLEAALESPAPAARAEQSEAPVRRERRRDDLSQVVLLDQSRY